MKNRDVVSFLERLKRNDEKSYQIVFDVRAIIHGVHPQTEERIQYGGIVFFLGDDMYSGIFSNKRHVTLEFSKGYLMENPGSHLEGKGKYRRHLKLRNRDDIFGKDVSFYVKQAV